MTAEMDAIRALLEARLEATRVEFRTEIDAMAKALRLAEQFPTAIDKAIGELRELHGQRIDSLEKLLDERFAWMQKLLDEQRRAEKEARDKAEQNFASQIKQIERTHESRNETVLTMLAGLEKSQTRLEGGLSGAGSVWGYGIGVLGLIIAALAIGVRISW